VAVEAKDHNGHSEEGAVVKPDKIHTLPGVLAKLDRLQTKAIEVAAARHILWSPDLQPSMTSTPAEHPPRGPREFSPPATVAAAAASSHTTCVARCATEDDVHTLPEGSSRAFTACDWTQSQWCTGHSVCTAACREMMHVISAQQEGVMGRHAHGTHLERCHECHAGAWDPNIHTLNTGTSALVK
jgi:hypothetical protein